jgi:hypothetical protein
MARQSLIHASLNPSPGAFSAAALSRTGARLADLKATEALLLGGIVRRLATNVFAAAHRHAPLDLALIVALLARDLRRWFLGWLLRRKIIPRRREGGDGRGRYGGWLRPRQHVLGPGAGAGCGVRDRKEGSGTGPVVLSVEVALRVRSINSEPATSLTEIGEGAAVSTRSVVVLDDFTARCVGPRLHSATFFRPGFWSTSEPTRQGKQGRRRDEVGEANA